MVAQLLSGPAHLCLGDEFHLFDVIGVKQHHGQGMLIDSHGTRRISTEGRPALAHLTRYVVNAVRAGHALKLAQLRITPRLAMLMFLEGTLSREDINLCNSNSERVEFHGIMIGGFLITISVEPDQQVPIIATDHGGKPLT